MTVENKLARLLHLNAAAAAGETEVGLDVDLGTAPAPTPEGMPHDVAAEPAAQSRSFGDFEWDGDLAFSQPTFPGEGDGDPDFGAEPVWTPGDAARSAQGEETGLDVDLGSFSGEMPEGVLRDVPVLEATASNRSFEPRGLQVGTNGKDTLLGTEQDDILVGLGGNDYLFAWKGSDTLIGGDGDDTLVAYSGKSTLIGGAGSDLFDYRADDESDAVIKDFVIGEDKLMPFDTKMSDIQDTDDGLSISFSGGGTLVMEHMTKDQFYQNWDAIFDYSLFL